MNALQAIGLRTIAPLTAMQASHALRRLIERVPWSTHAFWVTLIRLVIVFSVVVAAARFLAIAYAPQSSAMSQQLNCPPDVVPHPETAVSTQVPPLTAQSATYVSDAIVFDASDRGIVYNPDRPALNANEKWHRSGAKKPATFSRSEISPKRTPMGELTKRSVTPANQQTSKAPRPIVAQATIFPSPFGEMHGQ
jgi:hypothetical protein